MRRLFLSVAICLLAGTTAWAQSGGGSPSSSPAIPVGQTFKQFELPIYQEGTLKATVTAAEAKGVTLNRIEASDLKIDIYENGTVNTTVTSPNADLYVNPQLNEQKMRTKNTVEIVSPQMVATSQDCDFDQKNKKYLLRTNVKVVLKNFDLNMSTPGSGAASASTVSSSGTPTPAPVRKVSTPSAPSMAPALGPISPVQESDGLLENPGTGTNSAPLPVNSDLK